MAITDKRFQRVSAIIDLVNSNPPDVEQLVEKMLGDIEKTAVLSIVITMLDNLYHHDNGQLMKDLVEVLLLEGKPITGAASRATVLRGFWNVLHDTFHGDVSLLLEACKNVQRPEEQ